MSEIVVYTVAREGAPMMPVGEGWRAAVGDSRSALRAAVEAALRPAQVDPRRAPRRP